MATIATGNLTAVLSNTTKMVRKANGNLVTGVIVSGGLRIYEKANNVASWVHVRNGGSNVHDFALETIGNKTIVLVDMLSVTYCWVFSDTWVQESSTLVHQRNSQVGAVSIRSNREGTELHVACRGYLPEHSTTKPPVIFYVKGTIASNGEVTWASEVQITTQTGSYAIDNYISSIVVDDAGNPYIVFGFDSNHYDYTYVVSPSLPVSEVFPINSTSGWGNKLVATHDAGAHVQLYSLYTAGEFNVVWTELNTATGIHTLKRAKSLNNGVTWTVETIADSSNGTASFTIDGKGHMYILHGDPLRLTTNKTGAWVTTVVAYGSNGNIGNPSAVYDRSLSANVDAIPPVVYVNLTTSGSSVMAIGNYTANNAPTITVTSPTANQTLYENDSLNITGSGNDTDPNQSVTVYYQINNETRRVLATDMSQKTIALSKLLTFKGGKLYDGTTAVTGALTEGVAHKLKVWAIDDQGGQSTIAERTFYVVPNRAPSLTVDTPTLEGNIDTDKIQLNGTYGDPDGNEVTVSYKLNGSNSVQVASGVSGNWGFEITFGQLKEGANTIIIENIDSYGAKTSKTVKLNKNAVETPLLQSVARYKLTPPLNEATGVLLYVQRSVDLAIDVKISMTLTGEPESFVPMSLENTAPAPNEIGIVEDELYYIASESKQNIIVQIEMERSSIDVNDKIIVIEGAFY